MPSAERLMPSRWWFATHGTPSGPPCDYRATRSLSLSTYLARSRSLSVSVFLSLAQVRWRRRRLLFSLVTRTRLDILVRSLTPGARLWYSYTHHDTRSQHSGWRYLRNNCVFTWNLKRQKLKKMAACDGHTSICWVCGDRTGSGGKFGFQGCIKHFKYPPLSQSTRDLRLWLEQDFTNWSFFII